MSINADPDTMKQLWSMIRGIQTAMLVSEDGPVLRGRPMVAAQKEFDGSLYFFTRASAHKVSEVGSEERVCVTYADSGKQDYVSLSGDAALVRDPAVLKAHWSEAMRTWFPKGPEDQETAILKVDVTQAEYWDAPSSTMLHLFGYAKAVTTGKPPHPGGNEKVKLA